MLPYVAAYMKQPEVLVTSQEWKGLGIRWDIVTFL